MNIKDVHEELSSIRDLMERSSKFISLNGMSGVMAGVYALAGASLGYMLLEGFSTGETYINKPVIFWQLLVIALVVLALSILTACLLTMRKAKLKKEQVWNPVSRRLLAAIGVPLFTGGSFIMIMLVKGDYSSIAAACLIFYGLALVAGSHFTYIDVKWLGYLDILLGLLALIFPENGLILWTVGFGFLHILYGSIMHFKYDR